ncbi:unnamed protein product, partial [Polarella glacialis]
ASVSQLCFRSPSRSPRPGERREVLRHVPAADGQQQNWSTQEMLEEALAVPPQPRLPRLLAVRQGLFVRPNLRRRESRDEEELPPRPARVCDRPRGPPLYLRMQQKYAELEQQQAELERHRRAEVRLIVQAVPAHLVAHRRKPTKRRRRLLPDVGHQPPGGQRKKPRNEASRLRKQKSKPLASEPPAPEK